jgi:TolB-like protein
MAERPAPSYTGDQPFFFVSYGHADSEFVYPEMHWLQEAGFNLWYDEGIHVGSVWRKAIADALTAAAGMLFVATGSSVESDHCLKELSFALDEGKPVFVVQLDDTRLPGLLRLSLADRQMLKRNEFDEPTYRARLIQALSTVAKPVPRAAAQAEATPRVVTNLPSIGVQMLAVGDEESRFWAEGLVEDLATLLGRRLFEITTTHDATKDLAALGRGLDVSYVVSGNVRRAEDRYRVNLKLTKGGSGAQVWSARYDETGNAIDAADAVSRAAAIEISAAIIDDERNRVRDGDIEKLDAWELCLLAAGLSMNTLRERDDKIDVLRRAAERDPNFAFGLSMLASFLAISVMTMFSRKPADDIAESLRRADAALRLSPDNPVIMQGACLPHRVFGDEALALDLARRATAAGYSDFLFGARFLGNGLFSCLIQAGREQEAIELMLASRPLPERGLYTAYAAQGDWPEALAWAQRATTTYPSSYLAWTEVANAMAMLDRIGEAREVMRKVTSIAPTFKLAYYEKGTRISWRDRPKVVDSQLAGLRRLEMA